ncbi:DNA-binding transcriptional activator of the SARP family [Actinacidiphila yanglinensis]|uniref:DNA-binding transcriptional activator of the SARP family n=1 Tax=Actinacidiphila yanglinensis TaxID=310779 RepID=A0A1H6B912_9ACTN|nr:AfsR/SARP family transcriptional regulator [Actinacidiphila yanglinensis]SEG57351.1 DNA-binding transcriptional activator of the SARP family [Actinacidiphila yanglinensis]
MRFRLLGPLECVDVAGRWRPVTGPRQRVLLATLLLHANTPISVDTLADAVWDGAPPAGHAQTLRSHVMRLRRSLAPEDAVGLRTRAPGYVLAVTHHELDVHRFESLGQEAAGHFRAGAWTAVSDTAERALQLWRAQPLLDVPSQLLHENVVPRLEQLRLQLMEFRFDAELRLGRHHALVPQLQALVTVHPLHERFSAQLMLSLSRTGRRTEALAVYRSARRTLIDELGVEPGPEMARVHQCILSGDDPGLDRAA